MSTHIRHVPELHAALHAAALDHVYLGGPDTGDGPSRWLPCDGCDSVLTVRYAVVAALCEDCVAPCANVECALLVHEHVDGCEPYLDDEARQQVGLE